MSTPNVLANTLSLFVNPGAPQRLLAAAPEGALLVNNDTANAVWISDMPGVVPGAGYYLGVGGSLSWAKGNSAVYGCVDTGVTTGVSLSIGSSISQVDNPVNVGIAVAARLLETGIPNVFTSTIIGTYTIPPTGAVTNIDVTGYASLYLEQTTTWTSGGALIWFFTTIVGGKASSPGIMSVPIGIHDSSPPASIPVQAPLFTLENGGTEAQTFTLVGTNRPTGNPHNTILGYSAVGIQYDTGAITVPAGFTVVAKSFGAPFQGPSLAYFLVGGAVVKGQFLFIYTDFSNNQVTMIVCDTTEMHTFSGNQVLSKMVTCPGVAYQLVFQATTGGSGSELVAKFLPNY